MKRSSNKQDVTANKNVLPINEHTKVRGPDKWTKRHAQHLIPRVLNILDGMSELN